MIFMQFDVLKFKKNYSHLKRAGLTALWFAALGVFALAQTAREYSIASKIPLRENWRIQSSAKIGAAGDAISSAQFKTADWYPTRVPSTVVAALVENKILPDPFFGMNLRTYPGCAYPIGFNFSNMEMPAESPYRSSWWYRTEFQMPEGERGRQIQLHFDGINFRANIWLNGKQIANANDVAGTFRTFEFDVTDAVQFGRNNVLAVEVFAPHQNDLALTWVDWNPAPPDKNMGLWRDVYLTTSGAVTIRYPQVVTHFVSPALDRANLTVNAEVRNTLDHPVKGILRGRIEDVRFAQTVELAARETKIISFAPEQFPQLVFAHPRLWYPVDLGAPNLYELNLDFEADGRISDRAQTRFGIREITSEVDGNNHRVFKINGKNILIRGGGWSPDMLLRFNPQRLEDEFRYVRDMHLNAIRLEGKLESDYFYDLADRYGIMILAGWCCCDHWEHWKLRDDYKEGPVWELKDYQIAARSLEDQARRLRAHPSLLAWFNGSDNPPPADVEQMYIQILHKENWANPYLSSATAKRAEFSGASGVKMEGPYEWVPPNYWLEDKRRGGAHGFATEISPGPAVPPVESIKRMLPQEHWWPIDDYWNYHAGGGQFKTLKVFTDALNARYGEAKTLEDYAQKSQLMSYEAERAMFEAYARNKFNSTGVIQWMLNNAWPSMIWHLYDYYLRPGGGYFGTKKACEPVHAQFSYDDRSVVIINSTLQARKRLRVGAKIFALDMKERFAKETEVDLEANASVKTFSLPELSDITPVYFVLLELKDETGRRISSNLYWLSTKKDVLNWDKSTWYYTPTSDYADYTALQTLPQVSLNASGYTTRHGAEETARVKLENPSRTLAFFVRLQVKAGRDGEEILPVLWQDNYISLMPGERREIAATYRLKNAAGAPPTLSVSGWNIKPLTRTLSPMMRR
jgi:exo-1,4-beta-D-glucosaminidase